MKAYRQDFDAIATLFVGDDSKDVSGMPLSAIITETKHTTFAQSTPTHEAASIQRCWSTWNVLCSLLYTSELIPANPMPLVGRPKSPKTFPKAPAPSTIAALLGDLDSGAGPRRRWLDRR